MYQDQSPYPATLGTPPPPPDVGLVENGAVTRRPSVRTRGAIATLLLFATVSGETIATYNTPPLQYLIEPATGFGLLAFYGTGVLLGREIVRRSGSGWRGFIIVGIAFGFFNEGVIAGTWYTVKPVGYAFLGGIDWGWALGLTIFHTLFSVGIPIAVAEAAHPSQRDHAWLGRRGLIAVAIIFLLVSLLGLLLPGFRGHRAIVYLLAVGIGLLALRRPRGVIARVAGKVPGIGAARWLGLAGGVGYWFALLLIPGLVNDAPTLLPLASQAIIVAGLLVFAIGASWIVARWAASPRWTPRHTLALATGALVPTMLTSFFAWTSGEPVAEALALIALIVIARRLKPQPSVNDAAVGQTA